MPQNFGLGAQDDEGMADMAWRANTNASSIVKLKKQWRWESNLSFSPCIGSLLRRNYSLEISGVRESSLSELCFTFNLMKAKLGKLKI